MAAEQKTNETSRLLSMSSVQNVLGGTMETVNRFIQRPQAQPGSDHDERIVRLSAHDRKWLIQLSLCLMSLLSVPLFIILMLIASSSGSTMGFIISLCVMACCCCISCGNVYWVKKDVQDYQPIQ